MLKYLRDLSRVRAQIEISGALELKSLRHSCWVRFYLAFAYIQRSDDSKSRDFKLSTSFDFGIAASHVNDSVLFFWSRFLSRLTKRKTLQQWLYCREHLKYVWNDYCVLTNHRRDPYTTETTDNERFPICHGTNYFRFVLTFNFLFSHVNNCFFFLFVYSMYSKSEEYIRVWTIFRNKLQSRCAGPTRRFGVRIFKLFVTIEIVSYAWSQVTMKV